jgi:hypothetical protein
VGSSVHTSEIILWLNFIKLFVTVAILELKRTLWTDTEIFFHSCLMDIKCEEKLKFLFTVLANNKFVNNYQLH